MPCTPFRLPGGISGIICTRGRKRAHRCSVDGCNAPSGFQSDEPARVIERSASGTLVPLTSMKSDAPPATARDAIRTTVTESQIRFTRPSIYPDA